ncbi:MAG: hypothetical protein JSS07_05160 [Proteobacteria bacterium]|nr:hypothetical protein [Pseudomonadota bacterium]
MIRLHKHALMCLLGLVLVLMPPMVFSLGLGELRVHSKLNEPLAAEIPLIDIKAIEQSDIVASLADDQAYAKEGLELVGWVNQIQFQITKDKNEKIVIKLSTSQPIKDPFADLLVQVAWPNGKLVRAYALLLDPPTISNKKAQFKSQLSAISNEHELLPKTKKKQSVNRIYKNVKFQEKYSPGEGETLWGIARELVKESPFTVHQAIMVIVQKNPGAFTNGNINTIKHGAVLDLPSQDELSTSSSENAKHFVDRKMQPGQSTMTDGVQHTPTVQDPQSAQNVLNAQNIQNNQNAEKPLKLVSPLEEDSEINQSLLAPKGKNDVHVPTTPEGASQRLTLAEETLDTLKRTNQNLQSQNDSLAELLAAKEAELNRIRQTVEKSPYANMSKPTETFQGHENPEENVKKEALPSSTKAISQRQKQASSKNPTPHVEKITSEKSGAKNLIFTLFIIAFIFSLIGWIWYSRYYLYKLYQKLKISFPGKTIESQPVDIPQDKDIQSYSFQLDLDKAISAIDTQEKKIAKTQGPFNIDEQQQEDLQKKFQNLLEDAEIYIAYERYHQAEAILQEIINHSNMKDPTYWEAYLKLLELYVLTEKYAEYKKWYASIPVELKDLAPKVWSKINLLQDKVQSEMALHPPSASKNTVELVKNPVVEEELVLEEPKDAAVEEKLTLAPPQKGPAVEEKLTLAPPLKGPVIEEKITLKPLEEPTEQERVPKPAVQEALSLELTPPKLALVKEDEIQAQISLAKAYIEVGDNESANEILQKHLTQATPAQQEEIQKLLQQINQK